MGKHLQVQATDTGKVMDVWTMLTQVLQSRMRLDERGAVGWLLIGMIVGALLIIGLIIKLLIPGD